MSDLHAAERERLAFRKFLNDFVNLHGFLPEDFDIWKHCRERAALSAPAVPPGFVLVPVEPTEAMLNMLWLDLGDHPCRQHALEAWRSAIAAALSAKEPT